MSLSLWLYRIIRWGVGGAFVYAGILKLTDPEVFAVTIDAFGIVPEAILMPVAIMIPVMEILAGAGLIVDTVVSLEVITGLLIMFIAILVYGIHLGLDIDCGCFGPEDPEAKAFSGMRSALYRDYVFVGGILYLYGYRFYNRNVFLTDNLKTQPEEKNQCETC